MMERLLRVCPRLLAVLTLVIAMSASAMSVAADALMVAAAASLTNAFREVAAHFEEAHPDITVSLSFAASGVLLQQIARGAPIDLFAAADQATMDQAEQRGLLLADSRQDFTDNTLVLVAPADSNLIIGHVRDLANASVQRIAIGHPDYVPAGRYAKMALEDAGLWTSLRPAVITTQSVRQALDYVARGEVDVGFVYATDAQLMPGRLTVLTAIPLAEPVRYPIAITSSSPSSAVAERFIAYLLSSEGQGLLSRHDFNPL